MPFHRNTAVVRSWSWSWRDLVTASAQLVTSPDEWELTRGHVYAQRLRNGNHAFQRVTLYYDVTRVRSPLVFSCPFRRPQTLCKVIMRFTPRKMRSHWFCSTVLLVLSSQLVVQIDTFWKALQSNQNAFKFTETFTLDLQMLANGNIHFQCTSLLFGSDICCQASISGKSFHLNYCNRH